MTTVQGEKTASRQTEPHKLVKTSLDKDLQKIVRVEEATRFIGRRTAALGFGLIFLAATAALAALQVGVAAPTIVLVIAAVFGGYMALNIGANDVANNVGPAVGAGALTMFGALIIAAVFEMAGALIAGGDVVSTISKGIIDPSKVADSGTFVLAMMSALVSAALWINLATYLGAPVSTTHAVVGGVMGAGIAAAGFALVNWTNMGLIAASWVISPVLGGIIAALFLAFVKLNIIYQEDKLAAARRWVPALIAVMAAAFSCYLIMKGMKNIWQPDSLSLLLIGGVVFLATFAVLRPIVAKQTVGMENRNRSLRILFRWPLLCAAALLSFAHGANDVANAVGPLAAIIHAVTEGNIAAKVAVPFWVMLIGAAGISLGLFLFGPRIIAMVGEEITRMNPMRAYCVALSAAITVIVASWFGLPVSSTHIAVGAVFGVGFFREYFTRYSKRRRALVASAGTNGNGDANGHLPAEVRNKRKLVRRTHFTTIVAAWLITVPASACLAGAIFFLLRLFV